MLLAVEIKTLQELGIVFVQAEGKGILLGDLAIFCTLVELGHAAFLGILSSVEFKVAHGVDGDRNGVQPPVDQIEVVTCGP